MLIQTNIQDFGRGRNRPTHPLKLTALLYLREILLKQKYEDGPEVLRMARELGARDDEIRDILEDPKRKPG